MANDGERERLREHLRPLVDGTRSVSGWSFEYGPSRTDASPPWSYEGRARELLRGARTVIDLGTGGGERFSDMLEGFSVRAVATEEWEVNAPVAAARLRPLSVDVVRCSSPVLPFRDEAFDLVLDRHEELDPTEVARVLRTGGTVLTQQVHEDSWPELRRFFPRKPVFPAHFALYRDGFQAGGLEIMHAEEHWRQTWWEIGQLVCMLCVAPWEIPDFDPLGNDLDALLALQREASSPDGIRLSEGLYIIEARKPG
jgi:SAM-dependent methyltransferase